MPRNISQTTSTPVVQTVTVTLDADEIHVLVRALEGMSYYATAAEFRALLVVKGSPDAAAFLATGVCDRDLKEGRKIYAIKTVRAATGLGLKQAKDAVDAYERTLKA
jgi:ribosomal protein L7/L12